MNSTVDGSFRWLIRWSAPLIWRSEAKMAKKLHGFAAAEAGSALDMLKAAELCEDRVLRRLFFRHALDEHRHARIFREHAERLDADARPVPATRDNLFPELGLVPFVAFVHLAERRGMTQFTSLARHFADRDEAHSRRLAELFHRIAKEERFHTRYSRHFLERWRRQGRRREVRRALLTVRLQRAWRAWRSAGQQLGALLSSAIFALLYFVVLPAFVSGGRRAARAHAGWQRPRLRHSHERSLF